MKDISSKCPSEYGSCGIRADTSIHCCKTDRHTLETELKVIRLSALQEQSDSTVDVVCVSCLSITDFGNSSQVQVSALERSHLIFSVGKSFILMAD